LSLLRHKNKEISQNYSKLMREIVSKTWKSAGNNTFREQFKLRHRDSKISKKCQKNKDNYKLNLFLIKQNYIKIPSIKSKKKLKYAQIFLFKDL